MAIGYRRMRGVHLWVGAGSALFLLIYGVSALGMVYSQTLRVKRAEALESAVQLESGITSPRLLTSELMRRGLVSGELEFASAQQVRIASPAAIYDVTYDPSSGTARIRTSRASWMALINRLHHAAGFWHDWWVLQVWNGIVMLVSGCLIVLALTGVWMWWKRDQERVAGGLLLLISVGFGVTLLALCRVTD